MRWMWIDRIVELVPGARLVAVKAVSLSEDHLLEHAFQVASSTHLTPMMPGALIVEGMARSAGILVGHAHGFREKVILAKITRAELHADAGPGMVIRHTAEVERLDEVGAVTRGSVDVIDPATGATTSLGRVDLVFSHLDNNMSGMEFPEHNFVFGEAFRVLLAVSGVHVPGAESASPHP